jgi:hypothetical protein
MNETHDVKKTFVPGLLPPGTNVRHLYRVLYRFNTRYKCSFF